MSTLRPAQQSTYWAAIEAANVSAVEQAYGAAFVSADGTTQLCAQCKAVRSAK